jgi:hypothetical protein
MSSGEIKRGAAEAAVAGDEPLAAGDEPLAAPLPQPVSTKNEIAEVAKRPAWRYVKYLDLTRTPLRLFHYDA